MSAAVAAVVFAGSGARGDGLANLEFSPAASTVGVNDIFSIDLIARTVGEKEVPMSGMTVVLDWDPSFLQLVGLVNRPASGLNSSFPGLLQGDFDHLNQTFLDGDALYQGIAQLPPPPIPIAVASPDGLLVTTYRFRALAMTESTEITMPAMRGMFTETAIISGVIPGLDVLGTSGTASIHVVPEPASAMLVGVGLIAAGLRRRRAPRG